MFRLSYGPTKWKPLIGWDSHESEPKLAKTVPFHSKTPSSLNILDRPALISRSFTVKDRPVLLTHLRWPIYVFILGSSVFLTVLFESFGPSTFPDPFAGLLISGWTVFADRPVSMFLNRTFFSSSSVYFHRLSSCCRFDASTFFLFWYDPFSQAVPFWVLRTNLIDLWPSTLTCTILVNFEFCKIAIFEKNRKIFRVEASSKTAQCRLMIWSMSKISKFFPNFSIFVKIKSI